MSSYEKLRNKESNPFRDLSLDYRDFNIKKMVDKLNDIIEKHNNRTQRFKELVSP